MHSHEVAGGLLHRNKIKESVWIETMRRNSFKTTATLAFIVFVSDVLKSGTSIILMILKLQME